MAPQHADEGSVRDEHVGLFRVPLFCSLQAEGTNHMGAKSRGHNQFGGFCLFQGLRKRAVYLREVDVQKGCQDERKEKRKKGFNPLGKERTLHTSSTRKTFWKWILNLPNWLERDNH